MIFKQLCVLGLGYIGLPTASTFATHGIKVVGVDVNPEVVGTIRNGGLHIHEPGLRTLVQAALGSGNLIISEQPERSDAFIIAVPTPFYEGKRADLSYVISAAESITPHLRQGNIVILESTSPPRTTQDVVAPILERSGLKSGTDFHLAYSPERVLPGQILRELIENARVIGGITPASAELGKELYATFVRGEIIKTDATTAEMVKLMENTYRDVNIAIANEFSRLAERFGIDVWEAIALANRHPRVKILQPGPGVGGHCVSVDPWFLVEAAPDLARLILAARQVNDTQPAFVVECTRRAFNLDSNEDFRGKRIAILGLSYKPDVDDLRESPAVEIAHLLMHSGAAVKAFEPYQPGTQIEGLKTTITLEDAISEAELLLLLVGHKPLLALRAQEIARMTPARQVVDAVNGWNGSSWKEAGFQIHCIGVSNLKPQG